MLWTAPLCGIEVPQGGCVANHIESVEAMTKGGVCFVPRPGSLSVRQLHGNVRRRAYHPWAAVWMGMPVGFDHGFQKKNEFLGEHGRGLMMRI
jgi:hypothetical protein